MGTADKFVNKAYWPFWINQPENHMSTSLDLNKLAILDLLFSSNM
jgi:hypothetical protein